jgi:hypothetical protein
LKNRSEATDSEHNRCFNDKPFKTYDVVRIFAGYSILKNS